MTLVIDEQDRINITNASADAVRLWDNENLEYLKSKIRDYFINSVSPPRCCYCRKLFRGEFRMVIDTEHVLPQSIYTDIVFEPLNLNIACKRCNMNIKNENVDFIVDAIAMGTDYFHSKHYKFIHPNLDSYNEHIIRKDILRGDYMYVKFIVKNQHKGQYTYDYFKLSNLEIDNINFAQGLKKSNNISEHISSLAVITFLNLMKKI